MRIDRAKQSGFHDCCFGEAQHDATTAGLPYEEAMRAYGARVQAALKEDNE